MTEIFNQRWSIELRRALRNRPTSAEKYLWKFLKSKRLLGVQFRRQHNIGKYIVDFYVPACGLVIEIDGAYHNKLASRLYDLERTQYFYTLGLKIIRFTNDEVFTSTDAVLERLRLLLLRFTSPSVGEGE
jgi:very-short-patch-repair endonuclease